MHVKCITIKCCGSVLCTLSASILMPFLACELCYYKYRFIHPSLYICLISARYLESWKISTCSTPFFNACYITSTILYSYLLIAELQPNPDPESFRTISQVNFDARGLKYHMSDHGITVLIPENAVTTEALLSIGVYYVNSFQLPKHHRLVSEVFWIKTSIPLKKNAELYVPHLVKVRDENDSNKLKFFMAPDVSTEYMQTFTQVPASSCSFEPESSYGKLVMEHFCSGCILERMDGNGLPLWYCITRVFPNNFEEKEKWRADIVFSYNLQSCLKVCTSHKCRKTCMQATYI